MAIRICFLTIFSLCILNSAAGTSIAQQGSKSVRIHDVTHAAEKRWENARSGTFEWTETKWMQKGSLVSERDAALAGGVLLPPADVTHTYENRFEFAGDNYRFERSGPTWNAREGQYVKTEHLGVWDGHQGSVLRHEIGFPHGELYSSGWDLTQPPLRPLVLGLRPLNPR